MTNEAAYWIALAHLPKWGHKKINDLIITFFHRHKISIADFFETSVTGWKNEYQLGDQQIQDLQNAKSTLGSTAFLAESLLSQGFEIIPVTSPEYSGTLKTNLGITYAPAVLYVKGNKKILQERSVAIVGSRDASSTALQFTDNIAKNASREYKVVVSGFAKGVDKQALDSAIKYKGQSIIVLPQGILTFGSGFQQYYQQIINGDILVVSTFFPKAPWKTELAMARNPIIYGLADEIYVAESAEKGGTWSGVLDGLRKERKIYVRRPEQTEKNANDLLIQRGAVPVDFYGNELSGADVSSEPGQIEVVQEPDKEAPNFDSKIRSAVNGRPLTAEELLRKLDLNWTAQKLHSYLKTLDFIENLKENGKIRYKLKGANESTQTAFTFL